MSNCETGTTQTLLNLSVNETKTFIYSGTPECVIFNKTGYYKFELWGAQGNYGYYLLPASTAGKGGYAMGQIALEESNKLYIYIGQSKNSDSTDSTTGGFNGGGGNELTSNIAGNYIPGGGGGATDIRTIGGAWNNSDSLRSRIIVAGGGGGGSWTTTYKLQGSHTVGGYGGGVQGRGGYGYYGTEYRDATDTGGKQTKGGTEIAQGNSYGVGRAGSFGVGGNSDTTSWGSGCATWNCSQGGGGGGWYGGAGGVHCSYNQTCFNGGGGGSSYISGIAGFIGVDFSGTALCSEGSSSVACATSYTGYKFISGSTVAGNAAMPSPTSASTETGHSGNGYARISYLGTSI